MITLPLLRVTVVLSAALAICSGCITPLRASNRSFAPHDPASVRFPGNEDEAVSWLASTFEAQGFESRLQYGQAPNTVYVFQGSRGDAPGQVYWGPKGRAPQVGSTVQLGSIFFAYLRPAEDGTATCMTLYGKPTVAGHQVCSADDAYWNLPCVDIEADRDWSARASLNGAVEAATVRKLLATVPVRPAESIARTQIATFMPPSTLPRPVESFEGCEWMFATGSHFLRLYCPGGDKSVVDEDNEGLISDRLHLTPLSEFGAGDAY